MNVGGGRSEGGLPPEITKIITDMFGETSSLRQNLVGQMLGILTGQGPQEYKNVGTEGYWEEVAVPSGGGGQDEFAQKYPSLVKFKEPAPTETKKVWREGKEKWEWVPSGEAGAQIPIIAQAQEAQRRATSRAIRESETGLARQGLAGTPFGENILAQQRQQGAQAFAGIEPDIIGQFLQTIPGYTLGNVQSILGATPGARETKTKQGQFGLLS